MQTISQLFRVNYLSYKSSGQYMVRIALEAVIVTWLLENAFPENEFKNSTCNNLSFLSLFTIEVQINIYIEKIKGPLS